jgi:GT2 family glycosyltransferase
VRSLGASRYPNLGLIVVDNGSAAGSLERLRRGLPEEARLLRSEVNLGFAGGCNLGIHQALEEGAEFVFLLNSDARVAETTVGGLTAALGGDARAGAAGPALLTADAPPRVESLGARINLGSGRIRHQGCGRLWTGTRAGEPRVVDMVSGCALMLRREAVERAGLMDERFFCYLEEADWCLRLAAAGMTVLLVPGEEVRHFGGTSLGGPQAPLRVYYGLRNHLLLLRKNGRAAPLRWRLLRAPNVLLLWLLFLLFTSGIGKIAGLKMYRRALADYSRGRFGPAEVK